MQLFPLFSALLFATVAESAWSADGPTKSQREEAAPTGKLRVGVVSAPAQSAFFVVKERSRLCNRLYGRREGVWHGPARV
jgi:hypothetical protein